MTSDPTVALLEYNVEEIYKEEELQEGGGPNRVKPQREVATSSMENRRGSKQDAPPLTHFERPEVRPADRVRTARAGRREGMRERKQLRDSRLSWKNSADDRI